MIRALRPLMVLIMTAGLALSAAAAEFPTRPVRLVVPAPPGGTLDLEARLLASKLQEMWRQPVLIENRAGASTAIGVDFVAKSAPDGYTMVINAVPMVTVPHLQRTPYDLTRDLIGVVQVAVVRYALAAHPKVGVSSFKEFVELAKSQPKRLNYSSGGAGTGSHLYIELVRSAAGIELTHVPYKGDGPALQALLSGEVDLMFNTTVSIVPLAKAGKVRALLVDGAKPFDGLPNVPTFESLYPGVGIDGWHGVFAPSATPRETIDRIAADMRSAVLSTDVSGRLREMGFEATGILSDTFNPIVRRDFERWGRIIRDNNIRAD
jgi:tripartite-type tricarboxylate transporter receptor subunit TctC